MSRDPALPRKTASPWYDRYDGAHVDLSGLTRPDRLDVYRATIEPTVLRALAWIERAGCLDTCAALDPDPEPCDCGRLLILADIRTPESPHPPVIQVKAKDVDWMSGAIPSREA